MTLYSLVSGHSLKEPVAYILEQNKIHPEDWGSRCLQNAGNHLPRHTVSHPWRLQSEKNENTWTWNQKGNTNFEVKYYRRADDYWSGHEITTDLVMNQS
jgi:hypothetical protein